MRGVQVAVPQQAKDRLEELQLLRDSALEASHSAQRRINLIDGSGSQLALKLADERNRQANAHNVLHRLLSACNQYLFQLRLPPDCYLEPVTTPVTLKKGETAADAIEAIRSQITAVHREMAQVRAAPVSRQSQQDAIHAYLARLALSARPKVVFDQHGNAKFQFREDFCTMNDVVGLLSLICPAELVSAFQLDAEPDPENALSPADRDHKLSELAAKLLELEHREEVLLRACAGTLPRPEMNPLAYLQVAIVTTEAQQAVA
jgi:hypothetical protein